MADEVTPDANTDGAAGTPAEQAAAITVNAQYTKDLSFEVPNAPSIFGELQQQQPDVNINVEVNARQLGDKLFEVVLNLGATCQVNGQTGFILELVYAGLFTLNVPDEHRQAILLIECPRLLFPFARNIIADVTRDGGFPPIMLGQVDFVGMYQQRVNQAQQQQQQQGNGQGGDEG